MPTVTICVRNFAVTNRVVDRVHCTDSVFKDSRLLPEKKKCPQTGEVPPLMDPAVLLGPLHMIPGSGLARVPGRIILFSVDMENFISVTVMDYVVEDRVPFSQ